VQVTGEAFLAWKASLSSFQVLDRLNTGSLSDELKTNALPQRQTVITLLGTFDDVRTNKTHKLH